jgi:hypothetical protein
MFAILSKLRFVQRLRGHAARHRMREGIRKSASAAEAFNLIYRANYWRSQESASGPGSTLESTAVFRAEFEALLRALNVRTLFDAPCGDFNWMRCVRFPDGMLYIGADIVNDLIDRIARKYGDERRRFLAMDITAQDHPRSDLWLCRDALTHFSFADIVKTLTKFVESGSARCLLTTHPHGWTNADVKTGFHRKINLLEPPFRLPEADAYLKEALNAENARLLGLWRREQIAAALAAS